MRVWIPALCEELEGHVVRSERTDLGIIRGAAFQRFAAGVVTCSATVAKAEAGVVERGLEERNQKGELCASGWTRAERARRG